MEQFYFHNCLYEYVWKNNRRRWTEKTPTWEVLHKYPADYKVVFVGDASMSPYEITVPGGSVEHMNEESGSTWIKRVSGIYEQCVWLNPVPEQHWSWTPSIKLDGRPRRQPHVPADHRRPRPGHEGADAVGATGKAGSNCLTPLVTCVATSCSAPVLNTVKNR